MGNWQQIDDLLSANTCLPVHLPTNYTMQYVYCWIALHQTQATSGRLKKALSNEYNNDDHPQSHAIMLGDEIVAH